MMLDWRGDEIRSRMHDSTVTATDETTEAAVERAKHLHPWFAERGPRGLEGQIIAEPAHDDSPGVVCGRFGTTQRMGFYGLFLELGTMRNPDQPESHSMAPRPFLRPAGDEEFPKQARRIAERFNA